MALFSRLLVAVLCVIGASASKAVSITYQLTSLGGNSWRYEYQVVNTGSSPILEFSVFFDRAAFSLLTLSATPLNWDSLVIQPDLALDSDGYVDSLSLEGGLLSGASLSGLSVSFSSSSGALPASQRYAVIDPVTFETLESGMTQQMAVTTPIPEPASLALLAVGLLGLREAARRRL